MKAFALRDKDSGHIVLRSIRFTAREVREYAIETDREYALEDEDISDKALWKRNLREGWRVVPVTVSVSNGERDAG